MTSDFWPLKIKNFTKCEFKIEGNNQSLKMKCPESVSSRFLRRKLCLQISTNRRSLDLVKESSSHQVLYYRMAVCGRRDSLTGNEE